MYVSLNVGKTGLKSMQNKMDGVAEQIANASTYGYKRKEISFQELLNNQVDDLTINQGSKSGLATINFEQGSFVESSGDFHMAIGGSGFFGVRDENNQLVLTRNGGFHIDSNKNVVDDDGYNLDMEIFVPREQWSTHNVTISTRGEIRNGEGVLLARVILYNPNVLDSLTPLGEGRFLPSENVALFNSTNNEEMFGDVLQNMLEGSNVDMVKSMSDIIITQNAYSLNSRAIQTTDEMINLINGIKR